MKPEENKYLRQIANDLPPIPIEGGKVIYKHRKGYMLTKAEITILRKAMGKDDKWVPKKNDTFMLVDEAGKYHDHFKELCKAWEEKGNIGVDRYVLSARNLAATIKHLKENQDEEAKNEIGKEGDLPSEPTNNEPAV